MKLFKKKNEKAYKNLIESVNDTQRGFLMFMHGFSIEQLKNKTGDEICAECGFRGIALKGIRQSVYSRQDVERRLQMTTSEKNKLVETFVNITIADKCSRCNYRHNDSLCPKFVQYDEDNAFRVCKEGITEFWDNYLTEIQQENHNG